MTHNRLVLVDGSSYFFRAFHALPPLKNSKGLPTGAIYGVANMIKRLIKDHQPEHMAVVFDTKGKTFRDELYPEYKAHRPSMPEELSCQFAPMIELLSAMGLPILMINGVEADDVIGTLTHMAQKDGWAVLISTGDKDMAQLVTHDVTLINTMTNQILDEEGVKQKFGVYPHQIVDYLTLVGDSVDNVPGVPQCGPKTAAKWLDKYETLDHLITHQHDITGKIGDKLREAIPHLALSRQLVTIKKDVVLLDTPQSLTLKTANQEALLVLLTDLEFNHWRKELLNPLPQDTAIEPADVHTHIHFELVDDWSKFNLLLEALNQSSLFCIDTETTGIDPMRAELVGISLAIIPDKPVYIPLAHQENGPQLPRNQVLALLKPVLENPNIGKIGQNLKYDYLIFKRYGMTLAPIAFDTMLESYVLNSAAIRHNMDALAMKYLHYKTISFTDIAGSGNKQLRFDQIPIAKAAAYAAEDADITLKLHQAIYPQLDAPLKHVLCEIEIPLIPVLADIERKGVLIDEARLQEHGRRLKARLVLLEAEAISLAQKPFNLNSPKQLLDILYHEQKLPILAKTPKGQPSTAESVLQELAEQYRLPQVILEYRGLSKLVSTYIDALPKYIHPQTGRVHTSYNQAIAATGRLSSSEPNLQNIPIKNEEGRLIRKAFIAPPGHVLLTADYSQIELRIMAHLSQDEHLLAAFADNLDIHQATASEIFAVPLAEVTPEQRRRAKAVNFGLIYGMSSFGLAKQLGIGRQEAQSYIDRYFERYPGVLQYMTDIRTLAHQQGYVETLFGRRLYVSEINARNAKRQQAAERTAINAPMQGTAADIIKKAMLDIAAWQHQQLSPIATMIMQVHDELVFEVQKEALEEAKLHIRQLMEHTVSLAVPLQVSIGIGHDWDEAHSS